MMNAGCMYIDYFYLSTKERKIMNDFAEENRNKLRQTTSSIKIQATFRMYRQQLKDLEPGSGYMFKVAERRFYDYAERSKKDVSLT